MKEPLFNWLESLGLTITPMISTGTILLVILLTSLIIHVILHRVVMRLLRNQSEQPGTWWQDALFKHRLFKRMALTLQGIILFVQARIWLEPGSMVLPIIEILTHLWILLYALLSLFSLLDTLLDFSLRTPRGRRLPLRGIFQGIKLVTSTLVLILIVALLIGKSPLLLFSGLGAMTAVLLLVFKDPILGFVAGIQLSANKMLAVDDWLEMPKYGADGDVIDITLTTVKVRNWDKTITTIPTYALISDSFKNWRGMTDAGGRRIKRSVFIDATSVHFLDDDEVARLGKAQLLSEYIEAKTKDITAENQTNKIDISSRVNGRRLTNLGTFRAYLTAYLKANKNLHKSLTMMVRQLDPGPNGIPLEIYAFSTNLNWAEYEGIQADIFDHIFAVMPEFDLRVYQNPTGYDMRKMVAGLSAVASTEAGNSEQLAPDQETLEEGTGKKLATESSLSTTKKVFNPPPIRLKLMTQEQKNNPLHGITLEQILVRLVAHYGWEELGQRITIRCFQSDPSIKSSLKFLRKTPWAREKVEALYLNTPQ